MIALTSAKRKLRKHLKDSESILEDDRFKHLRITFNDDPTFNPFRVDYWLKREADEVALRKGHLPDLLVALGWASFYPTFMCHTRGGLRGKPFFLLPWQRDEFILPMMSWKNPRGFPRIRKADFFSAKKNGKTTTCTGLIAGKLLGSYPNIETYNCSYTKEQAAKLYRDTATVIENSPQLKKRLICKDHMKRINYPKKKSFFRVLPGERGAKAAEGIDATLVIMDEIHLMTDRALYDFVDLAGLAQDDFLLLSVSTVGKIDKTAIWSETYERAKDFMESRSLATDYFGLVYEADPIVATSPEARADVQQLYKANPSLKCNDNLDRGVLDPEILLAEVRNAEAYPAKLANVIQKIFNVPVAKSSARAVPIETWRELGMEMPDLSNRKCHLGLDMASHEDLAALVAFFPFTEAEKEEILSPETLAALFPDESEEIDKDYEFDESEESEDYYNEEDDIEDEDVPIVPGWLKVWAFCPATKVQERLKKNDPFYHEWAKEGWLIATRGKRISHKRIIKEIKRCNRKYAVQDLSYDIHGAEAIVQYLEDNTTMDLIEIQQTHKNLNLGTQTFLTLVTESGLRHEASPLMEWCCSNAAVNERRGAIKFDKEASSEKIDPCVAATMAIGRACLAAGDSTESYFDDDGEINSGMYD